MPSAFQPPWQTTGAAAKSKAPTPAEINQLIALINTGRYVALESQARLLTEQYPDSGDVWKVLGISLQAQGKDALHAVAKAVELLPGDAEAHCNMGIALQGVGRHDDAVACYRRALKLKPGYAMGHNNLGNALQSLGKLNDAVASYRQALQIKPDYAEAYCNLGSALKSLGRLDEAVASYRRALGIDPGYALVYSNLGIALQDMGRFDDAVASYRRALEINPGFVEAHSNLIFSLDLSDTVDLFELHGERKKWNKAHAEPLWQEPIHYNDRSPTRRLRVGYVSADFREHSASKIFGGMLIQYDRMQYDVYAYSNFKGRDDRFTDLFKKSVSVWRNIVGLSDEAVAKMIREDQIDILVDLSGFTAGNRLLVFARKPAPIQITAWGYATGTGMRAMDVFFADQVLVPPQDKQYFTEEVKYLPCAVGSFFNEPFPDVNELPALSREIITFGSFNRLAKVSDNAFHAWAEVLLATPLSRMILKAGELNDASVQEWVVGHFTKAGVAAERIIMQGRTSWNEHMQAYNQIDIALDPFPHGGGMTAMEGIMMGVPVITLRWPSMAGRASASIMTTMGLPDWIAETREEYIGLAIRKAADLQSLATLRQSLRSIFTASAIGDQAAYARAVEQEYRQLWREWCARQE